MVKTMEWQGQSLLLLDQTKLPSEIITILCKDYRRVGEAIKRLEVRGAPAIGAAAAFGMVLGWQELASRYADFSQETLLIEFKKIKNFLLSTRPTAVNLGWAVEKIYKHAVAMINAQQSLKAIETSLGNLACKIYQEDIEVNRRIGIYGAALLPQQARILTHCNAGALATCGWGTALGVVRQAFLDGRLEMVYADETRPLLQGARLTAWELIEDNIPVTLITDNMAAWVMQTQHIDSVIVGADRIAANGDTANKIGTYGVALAAKYHQIPFYIAAPISTFDFTLETGKQIPIEERSADEVRLLHSVVTAPQQVNVFNPAFDVTPGELITGIITEYGVISAPYIENIKKLDNIEIEGIYSHLASPDEEKDYTNKQISLFDNLLTKLSERNIEIKYKHILASTGITDYTYACYNMVRPGIIMYGHTSRGKEQKKLNLSSIYKECSRKYINKLW